MYKQLIKDKARFQTSKGLLSLEQLFGLSKEDLNTLALSLDESYKSSGGKSFLEKKTTKDKGIKLQFDVVIDILNTKMEEEDLQKEVASNKAFNQKIDEAIAAIQDIEFKNMSIAELEKMRKKTVSN